MAETAALSAGFLVQCYRGEYRSEGQNFSQPIHLLHSGRATRKDRSREDSRSPKHTLSALRSQASRLQRERTCTTDPKRRMTLEETIRRNAQLLIDRISQLSEPSPSFGYTRESVEWLDGFIERTRSTANASSAGTERLVQVLGSYLGECIIRTHGGTWKEKEGQLGVFFDDSNAVYPFNKVRKQFQNGREDSILSFFEMIGPIFWPQQPPEEIYP